MTTITHRSIGNKEVFTLKGHADYNPGEDVVCAGVSTITYGLINYLDTAQENGKIKELLVKDDPGDMEIIFEVCDFDEYKAIRNFVITTYAMISESYPNNVFIGGAHC